MLSVLVELVNENISVVVRDLIDERRVDTIHNFDNVIDFDSITNKSRFLKFQNTKLADFINLIKQIELLKIDDISPLFSNSEVSTQRIYRYLQFQKIFQDL